MRRTTLVEKMRKYGLQRAGSVSDLAIWKEAADG